MKRPGAKETIHASQLGNLGAGKSYKLFDGTLCSLCLGSDCNALICLSEQPELCPELPVFFNCLVGLPNCFVSLPNCLVGLPLLRNAGRNLLAGQHGEIIDEIKTHITSELFTLLNV